jgi:predicted Zn finger-like uncharacterized protein
MKITCSSCGSKYTIADAKVQGKKVKVRCKGCKESILVDGTQISADGSSGSDDDSDDESEAPAEEAPGKTAVATPQKPVTPTPAKVASAAKAPEQKAMNSAPLSDGTKSDLWSVNLSDDDSRDMTMEELVAGWKNGTVTSDAYVWKDGMGDWKPILEVGELKLKLGAAKKTGGVVSSASPAATKSGGKMDDLFGGAGAAPPKNVNKGPAPAGAGDKPTGARNDSSVLFSLDSLTGGPGGAPQAPSNAAPDLFAGLGNITAGPLGGNVDLLTAPAKDPPPAPAGNRAMPAPVEKSKSKTGMIIAIVAGLAVVGGAVFAFSGGGAEKPAEPSAEELKAAAEEKEAAEKAKKELEEKSAKLAQMEEELKKKAEAEKANDKAAEEKKKQEELEKEKAEAEKKAAAEKTATGSTATGTTSGAGPAPAPAPAASGSAPFDVGAAKAALNAAAANSATCAKPGGPTGTGKVQVTFATSGRVTTATLVSGPFGGTAVGGCVSSTFRRARVPAFSGSPQTVAKSFTIN